TNDNGIGLDVLSPAFGTLNEERANSTAAHCFCDDHADDLDPNAGLEDDGVKSLEPPANPICCFSHNDKLVSRRQDPREAKGHQFRRSRVTKLLRQFGNSRRISLPGAPY